MDTMYFGPMAIVVQTADDLQLPQFSLINKTDSDCSQNYTTGYNKLWIIYEMYAE